MKRVIWYSAIWLLSFAAVVGAQESKTIIHIGIAPIIDKADYGAMIAIENGGIMGLHVQFNLGKRVNEKRELPFYLNRRLGETLVRSTQHAYDSFYLGASWRVSENFRLITASGLVSRRGYATVQQEYLDEDQSGNRMIRHGTNVYRDKDKDTVEFGGIIGLMMSLKSSGFVHIGYVSSPQGLMLGFGISIPAL